MLTDKETLDLINEKNDKLFIKQLKKRLSKMPKEEFERSKKYLEKRGYKLIEMDKKEIKKIFQEIDLIIEQCKSSKPVPFEKSKFNRLYNKLKEKYV
jgi:hemerythrin